MQDIDNKDNNEESVIEHMVDSNKSVVRSDKVSDDHRNEEALLGDSSSSNSSYDTLADELKGNLKKKLGFNRVNSVMLNTNQEATDFLNAKGINKRLNPFYQN